MGRCIPAAATMPEVRHGWRGPANSASGSGRAYPALHLWARLPGLLVGSAGEGVITIPLDWTSPPIHGNQRMHWAQKAKLTASVRARVGQLARGQTITPPCEVVLVWTVTDKRRRDTDNPSLKAMIDGLRDARVFPDDNAQMVKRSWCEIELGTVKAMRLEVRETR